MRYVKIVNKDNILEGFAESIGDYISTHAEVDHVWYDITHQETFGYSNKRERENPVPGDFNQSGWYNFHLTSRDWMLKAQTLYAHYFKNTRDYGLIHIDKEVLYTTNNSLEKLKDSRVLVVGGGTSTKLHASELEKRGEKYDYLMTCNHFYRNPQMRETKFDVVFLGEEVDLGDPELHSYLSTHQPILGFEHGSPGKIHKINDLQLQYPEMEIFLYMTRYFSRLGYTSRQAIFPGLLGAREVSFMGLDGWAQEEGKDQMHTFEEKKKTSKPHYYVQHKWDQLGLIMWDYMLNSNRLSNTTFTNLADNDSVCQLARFKEFVQRGYTD